MRRLGRIKIMKKRGLPVRKLNLFMAVFTLVVSILLLVSIYRTNNGYGIMRSTTDDYIKYQKSAYAMQKGSDYLTEQVRTFAETGEKKYLDIDHENLFKYKVILPTSNGSGAIGEVIPTPLIGEPLIGEPSIGYTRSFIGVGAFDSLIEAEAAMKYIKSKFARVMLGILKITQDNNKDVWRHVPLQDFSSSSDIDWSKPIPEIDQQLYKKYGLSQEETDFIESYVKEME